MKKKDTTPKITSEISYRIFELTSEGHFREPTRGGLSGYEYIFDHNNGYPSISSAEEDIVAYKTKDNYSYFGEYIILPIIKTKEIIKEIYVKEVEDC